ncbi:hypothetical protein GCM10010191_82550 [Actinomadura vinacea]|uniref:Uncharacterized protein n=1 Tax=Actinomadura vinacea TaxID=115336 RepID=A0ABN3K7N3_9ACTN
MCFDAPRTTDLFPPSARPRTRLAALTDEAEARGLRAYVTSRATLRVWEPHRQHHGVDVAVRPHPDTGRLTYVALAGDVFDADETLAPADRPGEAGQALADRFAVRM